MKQSKIYLWIDGIRRSVYFPKAIMIIGALLLLGVFVFPLWSITLSAPQYPVPLGMLISVDKITDLNPHDVKNINILNHYIGMKEIPEHMKEFDIFPAVILIMSFIGVVLGFIGKRKLYLVWCGVMLLLGTIGLYDFYLWNYNFGHDLDPTAAMKFIDENGELMAYQPPLFGKKVILNITAASYPRLGSFLLFFGMAFSVIAYMIASGKRIVHLDNQLRPSERLKYNPLIPDIQMRPKGAYVDPSVIKDL